MSYGRLRGFVLSASLLLSACAAANEPSKGAKSPVPRGTTAKDFTTKDVDGKTFRLSDHIGKSVILIDFWATWCEPCVAEMPHLQGLYDRNKGEGFVVVGVSMDGPDSIAMVPSFVKRNGLTFPVVLDEDSRIASMYNPRKSAPLSVLIDRSGRIVVVREGYNPGDGELIAADVQRILAVVE
jgi:peroxiredoxin